MKKFTMLMMVMALLLSACSPKSENSSVETIDFKDVEKDVFATVEAYVHARLLTDAVSLVNLSEASPQELIDLAKQIEDAWRIVESNSEEMERTAVLYTKQFDILKLSTRTQLISTFFQSVYGADPATEWAESLTSQYDKIQGGNRLKQLAQQMGTDAKSAYKQLVMAQDILQRDAANAEGDLYEKWQKVIEATKTASKTGLYIGATIITAGTSAAVASGASLAEATVIIVGGVDVILDVGTTSSNIILGNKNKVTIEFDKMKGAFAPVSFVFGLNGFGTATSGEKLAFIGDNLSDWFNDKKIAGIKVDTLGKLIKDSAWVVDTANKSDDQIKQELKSNGETYPQMEELTFDDLLKEIGIDLDDFLAQSVVEQTGEETSGNVDTTNPIAVLDGVYSGVTNLYGPTGLLEEDEEDSEVRLQIKLNGDVLEVGDEEIILSMPYDASSQSAYYSEDTVELFLVFDTSSSIITVEFIQTWETDEGTYSWRGILTKE